MSITVHIYYSGKGDNAKNFAQEMVQSGVVRKEMKATSISFPWITLKLCF